MSYEPKQQPIEPQPTPPTYHPDTHQPQPTPPHQFQTAIPLPSLGSVPAPVDCPACGQRAMTNTEFVSGGHASKWALILCVLVCLPIPLCMSSMKDVVHKCGRCGVVLATWRRGEGGVDVHVYR